MFSHYKSPAQMQGSYTNRFRFSDIFFKRLHSHVTLYRKLTDFSYKLLNYSAGIIDIWAIFSTISSPIALIVRSTSSLAPLGKLFTQGNVSKLSVPSKPISLRALQKSSQSTPSSGFAPKVYGIWCRSPIASFSCICRILSLLPIWLI